MVPAFLLVWVLCAALFWGWAPPAGVALTVGVLILVFMGWGWLAYRR